MVHACLRSGSMQAHELFRVSAGVIPKWPKGYPRSGCASASQWRTRYWRNRGSRSGATVVSSSLLSGADVVR
eukprot:4311332-Pyramimonas_sp.AAC.1